MNKKTVFQLKELFIFRRFYPVAALVIFSIFIFFALPVSEERLKGKSSLRIFSKEGNLLRQFSSPDGGYSIWLNVTDFPLYLKNYVIIAEDRRFFTHLGFDPAATGRAAWQNITHRKIVSGGSTITQQFVRIAYRDELPSNIYLKKIYEIILAVKVELHCSKKTILEAYLNRVPLRFNQNGIPSASQRIFGRDVRFISKQESAALTVLIRENQPSRDMFRKRMVEILKDSDNSVQEISAVEEKVFNDKGYSYTKSDSYTPHFEAFIKTLMHKQGGDIHSSILNNLNEKIGAIINAEIKVLIPYNVENCSVVVLKLPVNEKEKTELAAMLGSQNFHGKISGQVNGCITIRSAGSTLKPLLYGLAMDRIGYRPYTILNDSPLSINTGNNETYTPKNNDMVYWGPIPLREALACSRNIPAVDTVNRVGINEFYLFLKRAGFTHMDREPSFYGPGLALGTGGSSLLQLCRGYAAIAAGGILPSVFMGTDSEGDNIMYGESARVLSEAAAAKLTNILSDKEARRRAFGKRNFLDFPFDVAVKTGTSKDCRDAWTIGYTDKYVVGVWVGNFSGEQTNGVSGGWGAGRIFHQVIRLLTKRESPIFNYPDSLRKIRFCRKTGLIAGPYCPCSLELVESTETLPGSCGICSGRNSFDSFFYTISDEPEIISPVHGESFIIDPLVPGKNQLIPLKIYINEKQGDARNKFYYRIDNGELIMIKKNVARTIDLKNGRHSVVTYRNSEIIQSVEFSVE